MELQKSIKRAVSPTTDDEIVLINGQNAKIQHNKSHSEDFTIKKATLKTVKLIDVLSMGAESSVRYSKGITTMRTLTTLDCLALKNTRPSNDIGIIRFYLPTNSVFTYRIVGEKLPRYGIAKSEANIKALQDLKENILKKLGEKRGLSK